MDTMSDAARRRAARKSRPQPDDIAWRAILDIRRDPDKVKAILDATGITRQAIWQWTRVPLERVLAVSRATGIASHLLRPDHYLPP